MLSYLSSYCQKIEFIKGNTLGGTDNSCDDYQKQVEAKPCLFSRVCCS